MKLKKGDELGTEKVFFRTPDNDVVMATLEYKVRDITVMPPIENNLSEVINNKDELTPEELTAQVLNVFEQVFSQYSQEVEEIETMNPEGEYAAETPSDQMP